MKKRLRIVLGTVVLVFAAVILTQYGAYGKFTESPYTLEKLQESENFRRAMQSHTYYGKTEWGEPIQYVNGSRFLPWTDEVICVPFYAHAIRDTGTAGSSNWDFLTGLLLWDVERDCIVETADFKVGALIKFDPNANTFVQSIGSDYEFTSKKDVRAYQDYIQTCTLQFPLSEYTADTPIHMDVSAATEDSSIEPNQSCDMTIKWELALESNRWKNSSFTIRPHTSTVTYTNNIKA